MKSLLGLTILGLVSCSPQGYGYIDKTGSLVISPRFGNASSFSEGMAGVAISNQGGYINKTGKLVIFPTIGAIETFPFSNGLAPVLINEQWGHINQTGKLVINPFFDEAANFAPKLVGFNVRNQYQYKALVNTQPTLFQYVRYLGHIPYFSSGLAAVVQGNRWGYIDTKGKVAIPLQFSETKNFSEELAVVRTSGEVIRPPTGATTQPNTPPKLQEKSLKYCNESLKVDKS